MLQKTPQETTVVLWGGLDPGGQAGLAADLQVANALHAQTRIVVTALTAQTRDAWLGAWPVANDLRNHIVKHLDVPSAGVAIKAGMLTTRAHAKALINFAKLHPGAPLVVDPLMAASAGGSMWPREDLAAMPVWLQAQVLPRTTVVTPNWPELRWLTGLPIATLAQAETALQSLPCAAVLKGGHAPEDLQGVDLVWDGQTLSQLQPLEIWHKSPRGTGCRFATALAIELARGKTLLESSIAAKALVARLAGHHGV
jgi:hydroxymethylpyrimidine/phosphomethylpyrimidine kinase